MDTPGGIIEVGVVLYGGIGPSAIREVEPRRMLGTVHILYKDLGRPAYLVKGMCIKYRPAGMRGEEEDEQGGERV